MPARRCRRGESTLVTIPLGQARLAEGRVLQNSFLCNVLVLPLDFCKHSVVATVTRDQGHRRTLEG